MSSTPHTRERVKQTLQAYKMLAPGDILLIAVSGGPDSLCLLHILHTLSNEFGVELQIAHLEHGIRGVASEIDATFVADVAHEWSLPCTVERRDVPAYAANQSVAIEQAAREVRYAFLAEVAQAIGAKRVAVAHQADDQIETILMNLLRGCGPRGLRGMRPISQWPFPQAGELTQDLQLIRPLLFTTRSEVEAYCEAHNLMPRFDHTNLDIAYLRNRIRHRLIPALEEYNPAIHDVLQRLGTIVADDYDYLQQQVEANWGEVATESGDTVAFSLAVWQSLHLSLQRGLLREAIRRLLGTLQDIEATHIELSLDLIRNGTAGSLAHLPGGLQLYKSYEQFILGETIPIPNVPQLNVDHVQLEVPGTTRLSGSTWVAEAKILPLVAVTADEIERSGPWVAYMDYAKVESGLILRQRQPAERFQPLGMGGQSKLVSDFMIDAKIPVEVRDVLPVVVSAQHIVWIPGWRLGERVKITDSTQRILRLAFYVEGKR